MGTLYLQARGKSGQSSQKRYPLLAKRLFLENPSDVIINFEPLRKQVKEYLASVNVPHSFYFEYLFTGSNIRDGENNKLVGASLMKIPIVMDLYKATEQGKTSLDTKVTVPSDLVNANDKQYGNQANLKPGDQITLGEAAKIALEESDNAAAYTIFNFINNLLPQQDQALNNLDIETQSGQSSDKGNYVLIGAAEYTSILRCLYFSCFLNPDDSQAVLNYLINSADNNRIRAGVPQDIQVARKIGSFSNITQSDCGIVYVPNRRYTLCIMLDEDATPADQHIKKISEIVYNYIKNIN